MIDGFFFFLSIGLTGVGVGCAGVLGFFIYMLSSMYKCQGRCFHKRQ